MPFDGSGTYVPPGPPVYPPIPGTVISSTYFISFMTDLMAGLNTTFLRDGQAKMTADIDLNVHSLKGVQDGTAASPSIRFSTDGGTGIFLNGAGKLCLAIAGAKIAEFTANGIVFSAVVPVVLTDAATITPDFLAGINFTLTIGGNRTLTNPTNMTPGQSGIIQITQDATGSRTLAYGSYWKFPGGAPVLSTTANAVDQISYIVISATRINAVLVKAFL